MSAGLIAILIIIAVVIITIISLSVAIKILYDNNKKLKEANIQLRYDLSKQKEFINSQNKINQETDGKINDINKTDDKENNTLLNNMYKKKE
jgi:predicted Holliday junction resolvase-like endonuclease